MGDSSKPENKAEDPVPWSHQPSPMSLSSQTSTPRQGQHVKLREYETRRRLAYTSKFDSMSLYWKSYQDLLSASLSETGRAQRLVLGTCRAHQLYAEAMKAMHNDIFLDEKGNIANDKQQKRLATSRKKTTRKLASGSVLTEIRETQHVLAQRFGENAENMDEEIAEAIGSLLEDLKQQSMTMEQLGSAVLSELEKTEQEVTQAWGKYLPKAFATGSPGLSPIASSSPQETAPKNGDDSDAWVVEMHYRVAVAYQNEAWEKGSEELTKQFENVKQEESLRRMNLREFLVAFIQRQQRLFLSLPSIQNSVLEDLVGKEMTLEDMELSIQSAIQTRTAKYKKDAGKASSSVSTLQQSTGGADDENFNLESPLASDLLCKAKVVERRGIGIQSTGWQTSLAVMTADSYLHLFDVDSSRIQPGSSPESAFKALMPNVVVPTTENLLLAKSNFTKGWSDALTPSESLILSNCTIKPKDETTFELVETVASTGASKMFGKSATKKKVQVRTLTNGEMDDWIAVLTA